MDNEKSKQFIIQITPAIFVLLWSTGFIGAKLGLPYVEPFTFLTIRMGMVVPILILLVAVLARNKAAPRNEIPHAMFVGLLVHCCYLGGVFFAISRGMSAGISALIVALQPLVTAIFASWILGEKLSVKTLIWFFVALGGVLLVLWPKLMIHDGTNDLSAVSLIAVFVSVIGISLGAVYQKRFVRESGLLVTTLWQYVGALIGFGILSFAFETRQIIWSGELVFALGWLILVLSVGAVLLLMYLVRRDSAAKTASLFFLIPAVVAVIAWAMFGETLVPIQLAGMAVIMVAIRQASKALK